MATYVYGNVVRQEPKQMPKETRTQTRPPQRKRAARNKVLHMNRGYVVFLAVAAMVALFVCVQYLQLQSDITKRSQYITSLQKEIAAAKEANTTKDNEIMNSMNLEEVRDVAMNEFGMTYAKPEQVIEYSSPEGNSVKQYAGIPDSGVIASSDVVK